MFKKGALVAQSPDDFEHIEELDENDRYHLRREITSESPEVSIELLLILILLDPWRLPRDLYFTIALCSLGSAIQ